MTTWKDPKYIYSASLKTFTTTEIFFKKWEIDEEIYEVLGRIFDSDELKIYFNRGSSKVNLIIKDPESILYNVSEFMVLSPDQEELKKFVSSENFKLANKYLNIITDNLI